MLLTAYCPTVGDIYQVYNSSMCDATCNSTIHQYPDASKVCQLCSLICYTCSGTPNYCTSCYQAQNRILSGNTCICDPINYYDDGVNLVCPICDYSCKSCTGPTPS